MVNLDRLSVLYPEGGEVTPESLVANGAVRDNLPVKILGRRRDHRRGAGQRPQVLGHGEGQDRGCRRVDHRALTVLVSAQTAGKVYEMATSLGVVPRACYCPKARASRSSTQDQSHVSRARLYP